MTSYQPEIVHVNVENLSEWLRTVPSDGREYIVEVPGGAHKVTEGFHIPRNVSLRGNTNSEVVIRQKI